MKTVFLFTLLLIFGSCRFFYLSQRRSYYSNMTSSATSIALPPRDLLLQQINALDYVIGTENGDIYVQLTDFYDLQCVPNVTSSAIKNLTWTNYGLLIVSEHQAKVVNFKYQKSSVKIKNQNNLSFNFSDSIYNTVYGYSNDNKSIFIAISFSDRLQVFQNSTSLYNISLFEPCYSMSFNQNKNEFQFITRQSSNESSFMYRFKIRSKTLHNTTISSQDPQTCLSFIPTLGFQHLLISTNQKGITQWDKYSTAEMNTNNFTFSKIKFATYGQFLTGPLYQDSLQKTKSFGIVSTGYNSSSFYMSSEISQNMTLDTYFVDFDAGINQIVILTDAQQVLYFQVAYDYESYQNSNTWIIIVGSVSGFVLTVAIIGIIFKVRKLRQKHSQFNTQQDQITNPVVQSDQRFPPIKQNEINHQEFYQNQINKNEQFYNAPYRPPPQFPQ